MDTVVSIIVFSIFLFILLKMIDMKFVQKEMKPLKEIIRDAIVVGLSVTAAAFAVTTMNKPIAGFFDAITEKQILTAQAPVFTDNPGF